MNIKTFLKRNRIAYSAYYYIASFLINFYKLFVRTDNNLILFVSYGGRHYSDSPRYIYEAMLKDARFKKYKMIWAFIRPEQFPDIPNKICIDSFEYIKIALKARCWITNVIIERALNFTGKNTYYFHTTHGVLCKLDGLDAKEKKNFKSFAKLKFDCCTVQSEYEKKIYAGMWGLDLDKVVVSGFAKNDILVHYTNDYRNEVRKKLGIPEDKKAILYAPTWRDEYNYEERFDLDVDLWRRMLGEKYVLLYRAHPIVSSDVKSNDSFFIDTTHYEMVEDVMIASDILVSDYSGIIFDYCVMEKPIFLWTYDYDRYNAIRGLYFDIRRDLPSQADESQLLEMIKTADLSKNVQEWVIPFREKYATEYGRATERAIDLICENINL